MREKREKREKLEDSQYLAVKLSRSTSDRLREHCEHKQCTLSQCVRGLLNQHLEQVGSAD